VPRQVELAARKHTQLCASGAGPTALGGMSSSSAAASSSLPSAAELSSLFAARAMKKHQTKPTPSNGTGAREFYESLWREKGLKSPMALIYLVEHGCLSDKELAKVSAEFLKVKGKA
jgi:hypothetical protein